MCLYLLSPSGQRSKRSVTRGEREIFFAQHTTSYTKKQPRAQNSDSSSISNSQPDGSRTDRDSSTRNSDGQIKSCGVREQSMSWSTRKKPDKRGAIVVRRRHSKDTAAQARDGTDLLDHTQLGSLNAVQYQRAHLRRNLGVDFSGGQFVGIEPEANEKSEGDGDEDSDEGGIEGEEGGEKEGKEEEGKKEGKQDGEGDGEGESEDAGKQEGVSEGTSGIDGRREA
ncbi:hypothetical protein P152DRAFT_513674 [Eremomyces bilateralis CBS 781.70]|uniref:Histone chaperone domain-containing protein n=1 Tax=Eremomyces bilateralis CBS 781.70 TaxID=1392243 RepID=A0A6G1G5Z4_9PEZI|nr:uncharacterized protein P152DRAFT_513674 [Eremomyces bilateralis CBS 781.70]KAF1813448.1 hypothetical protein P152DRAFT_513674 [Eremomyces bilateralis CBS 781.70]